VVRPLKSVTHCARPEDAFPAAEPPIDRQQIALSGNIYTGFKDLIVL